MKDRTLQQVLRNYVENKATPEEISWLLAHFHTESEDELMKLVMKGFEIDLHTEFQSNPDHAALTRVYSRLQQDLGFSGKYQSQKRVWKIRKFAAAAVIAGLTIGGYFMMHQERPAQKTARFFKNDILPGHNQATLTLASGKKIVITKGLSGLLAQQGQTNIQVSQSNITYTNQQAETQVSYNTLTTTRGEQSPYPLILSDGTKVWLNTASSITFPTAFSGNVRIVKITGEALFEVKHNASQPFKVQTAEQTIEDIGTIFDVNAYSDEPVTRTTLIEGKVKVNNLTLNPGQQTDGKNIKTVNTEIFTAWKDGNFHFEGDNIQSVMRQLSRWYNIDVTYQGPIPNEVFYGDISRNRNISAALKLLQNTKGVHFKIEGRRVTIME